jgi:hypothetical protein
MSRNIIHKGLILLLSLLSFSAFAQVDTRGKMGSNTDTTNRLLIRRDTATRKMLIIPFETKMCMSEIGKEVHAKTNLSFDAITAEFRNQLDLAMYAAFRNSYSAVSVLQGRHKGDTTLDYIYSSIGYQYDIVPGSTPDAAGQSEHDKSQKNHFINNGQLQVPVDYSNRFMNASINNPNLLSDLAKKFSTNTYVFINELDIKSVANTTTDNLSEEMYRRQVIVHYSILDKDGKYVSKGIATTYFPQNENEPRVIGEKYFSVVAHTILKDYIQAVAAAQAEQQKKQQGKTKSTSQR